jgi:hypothetical protein
VVAGIQILVLVTLIAAGPQQGSVPTPAAQPASGVQPSTSQPQGSSSTGSSPTPQQDGSIQLPVSMERIQEALSRPPAIKPSTNRPVFRVEVFARNPTVEDILGPDYLRGPIPAGGMTHREFLDMVTPSEFRGMGVFTGKEALTIAATSIGLQWALMKAIDKLKDAHNERAKEAARQEVIAAMNELEAARKKAGQGK